MVLVLEVPASVEGVLPLLDVQAEAVDQIPSPLSKWHPAVMVQSAAADRSGPLSAPCFFSAGARPKNVSLPGPQGAKSLSRPGLQGAKDRAYWWQKTGPTGG